MDQSIRAFFKKNEDYLKIQKIHKISKINKTKLKFTIFKKIQNDKVFIKF